MKQSVSDDLPGRSCSWNMHLHIMVYNSQPSGFLSVY